MPASLSIQLVANTIAETQPELRADLLVVLSEYYENDEPCAAIRRTCTPEQMSAHMRRIGLFVDALGG
jgi:hypothetical protein